MRYSNYIGILAGLLMLVAATFPWIHIVSINATVSGFGSATVTKFGMPVLMNIIMLVLNVFFFLIPRLWAKRINPFIASIGFAWSLRNLLLLSTCRNGECPERFIWLYIYFVAALIVLIMTLVPEIKIKSDNKD